MPPHPALAMGIVLAAASGMDPLQITATPITSFRHFPLPLSTCPLPGASLVPSVPDLLNHSLNGNAGPSTCKALEQQPGMSQTPPRTELPARLCPPGVCQLPPSSSSLLYRLCLRPSLEAQLCPHTCLLLVISAWLPPGKTNPRQQIPNCPSITPADRLAGATRDSGTAASLHTWSSSPSQPGPLTPTQHTLRAANHLCFLLGPQNFRLFSRGPQTSSSHSHTTNENNPRNFYPNGQ